MALCIVCASWVSGCDAPKKKAQSQPADAGRMDSLRMSQSGTATEACNKQLIQQEFTRWANGSGNFFDLLTDDVRWTITGSSAYSKTYTNKKQFMEQAVKPLSDRLSGPVRPVVRNLYADGDVVVAIWDGTATATDGRPYRNTYCWAMTLREGRITHVVAFLDLIPYLDVINRIPAPQ